MNFFYREVGFGTHFEVQDGLRKTADQPPNRLFANEIAVDVGGVCFGYKDEPGWIFDHHFTRTGNDENFPCAAVAVIHGFPAIRKHFDCFEDVWIVTHKSPDFDACSSSYLVRKAIEGAVPLADLEAWTTSGIRFGPSWTAPENGAMRKIDWFAPDLHALAVKPVGRWPILLAAYAACVDNCKRVGCRKTQTVNAVLSAAICRGRSLPYRAYDFFELVRNAIAAKGLNPLFDSLFEGDAEYLPELQLLEQQSEAYERDIRRARKCLVYLDVNSNIGSWFKKVEGEEASNAPPAFMAKDSEHVEVNPAALDGLVQSQRIEDGLYLADPECLLFKDWVRDDTDNSQGKQGFLFTAIAYSNPQGSKTQYFLSIDPERAKGANLYRLWARLQAAELTELRKQGGSGGKCRGGFATRARGFEPLFDRRWVWYDGQNSAFTIVVNGDDGTQLQSHSGKAPFTDDEVGRITREELEYGFYRDTRHELSAAEVVDFPLSDRAKREFNGEQCPLQKARETPLGKECYRFAAVKLSDQVKLSQPGMGEQIGRTLWPFLEDQDIDTVPADFSLRHLDVRQECVIVWNRAGMAIAYCEAGSRQKEDVRAQLQELAKVNRGIQELLAGRRNNFEQLLAKGQELLKHVLQNQLIAVEPNRRHLRLFLEMTQFDRHAHAVHSLNAEAGRALQEKQNDEEEKRRNRTDMILAILGAVFVIPSLILSFLAVITSGEKAPSWQVASSAVVAGLCFSGLLLGLFLRMGKRTRKKCHTEAECPGRE